jgi:PKD repeat protein
MRRQTTVILSVCLLTSSILIFQAEEISSTGTPFADAGPDQTVSEGEIVQFNGTGSIEELNVLHVSVWQHNEIQMIIDYTGSNDKFEVTQVSLSDFNAGTPSDFSSFDAIIFGLSNGFEANDVPIGRTSELEDYVFDGGGIIWTHDSLELTWDYGSDLEGPAGVDFDLNYTHYIGLNVPDVEIIVDHEILHNLFEIGNVGDLIPKTPYPPPWFHYTHTSYSNVTTADIIIEHDTTSESKNFYLTTEEYGLGRVVVDIIGHTVVSEGGAFLGLPSLKECQILVNAIYWVTKGDNISSIISYSWDFDANVDLDGDGNPTNDIDATAPTPTYCYGDDGIYTVILNVTDSNGKSDTDIMLITVNNVAPIIYPFGPFVVDEDTSLIIASNATDPGSDDLNFTWDWGDGTSDTTKVHYNDGIIPDPYPSPGGNSPFNATDNVQHIYNDDGTYTLNLTVGDDDGGVTFYTTTVTVNDLPPLPPKLHIKVSQDGDDVILYWDPPPSLGIEYYLIYRSTSQTGFDFNLIWVNTSIQKESGEPNPIPLRTIWNDTNAALPGNLSYREEFYYIIRAVNDDGELSRTSRTVGKWTRTFSHGVSTFSLPLEPLDALFIDNLTFTMNASYMRWMNATTHKWMQHNLGDCGINNTQMNLGEAYEVKFTHQTIFTFTGMPGSMISYEDISFGFDPTPESGNAQNLTAFVDSGGNVTLFWTIPKNSGIDDTYWVFRSENRDGFWGTIDIDYMEIFSISGCGPGTVVVFQDCSTATPGTEYYYMIVPVNSTTGKKGVTSYSIGIWTEEYLSQYDTFGIPLKSNNHQTADWYCDNIPETVGINYYINSLQRWYWHSTRMREGAYDPVLEMTEGYQISTVNVTLFTFIGV